MFPFWGNWCLADFALASMPAGLRTRIVLDEEARSISGALAGRWKGRPAEIVNVEGGAAGLARLFAAEEAECIVLGALSAVWLLEPGEIDRLAAAGSAGIVKASIQRTPIELYVVRRDQLIASLEAAADRPARGRRAREALFESTLTPGLEVIEELAGELHFLNDLSDLHRRTLRLAAEGAEIMRIAARFPESALPPREALIAERARVVRSWIAPGAQVEGTVEESVIFPGAAVRRGAQVTRSVVMNGVVIGAGAVVANALLLPWGDGTAASLRPGATIGERSNIGQRQSTARNADYPELIRDGLAVVGMDVTLPAGFRMEGGCLVGPGADPAGLRRMKALKRGQSVGGPGER